MSNDGHGAPGQGGGADEMGRYVTVAAAMVIEEVRLRKFLQAPVARANTWPENDWAGICAPWSDEAVRLEYREQLTAAIAECDGWIDGTYAELLLGIDEEDGSLSVGFDEASGSLVVEFEARVDFPVPSLIWALTVFRGMAGFMVDDETGIVTVTADWDIQAELLMLLEPGKSEFPGQAQPKAKDRAFDIRCAVGDSDESASELIGRLSS
ncbi:hypothetical protein [Actinokineospora enzanensis]|uniref:hypothetical protein n=1 Tax=Actinokineospora enzanensis TaxID=155975 RepID=UPI0012EB6FD2|nr:hypothetical protein [Actinokineospora enzanensis]